MDFVRRLVPAAIRRRYAVKFGIVLLVLGLSVGLIGFVATAGITTEVEDRVESDQTDIASQEAQGVQMWNEQNERTLSNIAYSEAVVSDDTEALQQRFLEWDEHIADDTHGIDYVDTDNGTILATTHGDRQGGSIDDFEEIDADAFAVATDEVPWVSAPYVADGELGEQAAVVSYVLSVPNADDRAIVYTAEIESHGSQLEDREGVVTLVVDGNNEIILDNAGYGEDYATLNEVYDDASIVDDARTDGATTRQVPAGTANALEMYDFPAESYVVSSARVYGTDWVVLTHEPESQAYGFVQTVNDWGYYATAGGVLLIGLIGAVLGRNTAVSIDRLTRKAGEMEEGNLDVDLETKRIDNIGRLYDGFDSMRVALREQIKEAEAARDEAEQERERIAEINDHLERKATAYSDVMETTANGDLTARMTADSENEAMNDIADDFNEMLEEIEATIAELSTFATDVATASEQVTASSEEVRSASEQVTESIQEISDGAERQNESLQSVNQEMSGLSTTTEEIAASSNEVADIAERTVQTGQEGQEAAQDAISAMTTIEREAEDAVAEMRRLEQEVQQIDELIATISEIARQTNMLALNANIEASRSASGEDEEGFAVVAKEVKALSEDVAEAADEAEDRLEGIRERTEQSTAEVEGTSENIHDAGERVEEAVEALEEIADLARETNVGVQEISAATEEQAASTQEVVAIVDEAATVSEETTAEAENVAAAAEEQTTALTEVTEAASNLSGQSSQLSEALDRFETDPDAETGAATLAPSLAAETDSPVDTDDDPAEPGDDADGGVTFDAADGHQGGESLTDAETVLDEIDTAQPGTANQPAENVSPDPAQPAASSAEEREIDERDAEERLEFDEPETQADTEADTGTDGSIDGADQIDFGSGDRETAAADADPLAATPTESTTPTDGSDTDNQAAVDDTDDHSTGDDQPASADIEAIDFGMETTTDDPLADETDDPLADESVDTGEDPLADDAGDSLASESDTPGESTSDADTEDRTTTGDDEDTTDDVFTFGDENDE
ncbi:methyl-accepting chemotaxis protein [Salinadaptatus halalkaliphilus]|uniref:Methyl-accepting chemotaxis protein n=1 Tax=Salinadaptatus halalkaliphilus TaxID=2419781 RepID=A0A4S3TLP3_9EURY|nr:methyl-accepting chemotaxis protein [Salinadaptatus halalkaliphilus]THE63915.1 methyl-accepting chemotaxis protein [Salinadaptatus halalkaliphilus]